MKCAKVKKTAATEAGMWNLKNLKLATPLVINLTTSMFRERNKNR